MSDNKLPFALSFERQYAGPLDPTEVFATIAERDAYLNNATRYPGQPVTCLEVPGKIFILSNDRSAWLVAGGDVKETVVTVKTKSELENALSVERYQVVIILLNDIVVGTDLYIGALHTVIIGGALVSNTTILFPLKQDLNYKITIAGALLKSSPAAYPENIFWGDIPSTNTSNLELNIYTVGNLQFANYSETCQFTVRYYNWNFIQQFPQGIVSLNHIEKWTDILPWNYAEGHTHNASVISCEPSPNGSNVQEILTSMESTLRIHDISLSTAFGRLNTLDDAIRNMGGILSWSDSGEDQILGAAWTLEGTLVGDKFDIVIRMAVSPVTGSSVDSLEIRPLAQFAGMRVHSKFLECIVTESTDDGSGTMGLLVYHFYQNNQHAYANQMSSLNEINESCYISNYNDTQSSSYYYNSGVLADANDIVFAFNGDGYWETRPVRRVKEYHYSGILLGTITPTEIPA